MSPIGLYYTIRVVSAWLSPKNKDQEHLVDARRAATTFAFIGGAFLLWGIYIMAETALDEDRWIDYDLEALSTTVPADSISRDSFLRTSDTKLTGTVQISQAVVLALQPRGNSSFIPRLAIPFTGEDWAEGDRVNTVLVFDARSFASQEKWDALTGNEVAIAAALGITPDNVGLADSQIGAQLGQPETTTIRMTSAAFNMTRDYRRKFSNMEDAFKEAGVITDEAIQLVQLSERDAGIWIDRTLHRFGYVGVYMFLISGVFVSLIVAIRYRVSRFIQPASEAKLG